MSSGCGFKCAKATLFGLNFLFWVLSLAILAAGIWMRVDTSFLERQGVAKLESDALSLSSGGVILIGVAAVCVMLGFFGCCGTAKESRCMLGIYITFILIILFVQLLAAALGVFSLTVFKQAFEEKILNSMTKNLKEKYGTDKAVTDMWSFTQYEAPCCGASGPIDYHNSTWYAQRKDTTKNNTIPSSCCKSTEDKEAIDFSKCQNDAELLFKGQKVPPGDGLVTTGCYEAIKGTLKQYSTILIGISVGVSAIELFCFILGVFLCCNVGKYSYDYE